MAPGVRKFQTRPASSASQHDHHATLNSGSYTLYRLDNTGDWILRVKRSGAMVLFTFQLRSGNLQQHDVTSYAGSECQDR
jgi:hypothetical protein